MEFNKLRSLLVKAKRKKLSEISWDKKPYSKLEEILQPSQSFPMISDWKDERRMKTPLPVMFDLKKAKRTKFASNLFK